MNKLNELVFEMRKDYKKSIDFYKELLQTNVYLFLKDKNIALLEIKEENLTIVDVTKPIDLLVYEADNNFIIPVFSTLEDLKKAKETNKYIKMNFLQFIANDSNFDVELNPFSDTQTFLTKNLLKDLSDGMFFELNILKPSLSSSVSELILKEVEDGVYKNKEKESIKMRQKFLRNLLNTKVFVFFKQVGNEHRLLSLIDEKEGSVFPCFLTVEDVFNSDIEEPFVPIIFKDILKDIIVNSHNIVVINPFSHNRIILSLDDIEEVNNPRT